MSLSISVITPVHNATRQLDRCLTHLRNSRFSLLESIVVDDGSTDDSGQVAYSHQAKLLTVPQQRGPAYARNLGASVARGDILLFLDADVLVRADTLEKIASAFERDPALDALIGSYDNSPEASNLVSQYKNLLNHYHHQTSRSQACTFWTACGAIRREIFLSQGGFNTKYDRPCIEDIDLGYRLVGAGKKLMLDNSVQVKHLKRWTLRSLIATDVVNRAIPWTELTLQYRFLPNDLNFRQSQRLCVGLVFIIVSGLGGLLLAPDPLLGLTILLSLAVVLFLNRDFYLFLGRERGIRFALSAIPLHLFYFFYSGLGFLIGVGRYVWNVLTRRGRNLMRARQAPD